MPRLTDYAVARLLATGERQVIKDTLAPLELRVSPDGRVRSWSVRYRAGGQQRRQTLGTFPAVGVAAARKSVNGVLAQVAAGRDPVAEAKAARRDTVGAVLEVWLKREQAGNRSVVSTTRIVKRELERYVGRPIRSLTKRDMHEVVDGVLDRGAPIMARRLFAHLHSLFRFAVERDYLAVSPLAGMKAPAASKPRERVLTDAELVAVWRGAEGLGWPWATIVRLLVVTGQRLNEIAGMRWGDVDLAAGTWTIPAEVAKNGREHVVPLSAAARALLVEQPRISGPLVFSVTERRSGSASRAKAKLDQLSGVTGWRFHDLRRTAATGLAKLGTPLQVTEAVLNHIGTRGGLVGVYQRHEYADEKRTALEAWSEYVGGLVAPRKVATSPGVTRN